jgi:hypothetical protein
MHSSILDRNKVIYTTLHSQLEQVDLVRTPFTKTPVSQNRTTTDGWPEKHILFLPRNARN